MKKKKAKGKPAAPPDKLDGDTRTLTPLNRIAKNPRKITPEQLKALNESLKEFGDLGGFIFNKKTGHIVGGNQRSTTFNRDELKATITQRLKNPDRTGTVAYGFIAMHGTRYSYREVEWSEERELAANIAANQHGGEFNEEQLKDILAELKPELQNLTGFSKEELDEILEQTAGSTFVVSTPDASTGFAGGQQFKKNRSAIIEIRCTEKEAAKPALKSAIQSACDKFSLSFKVRFQ